MARYTSGEVYYDCVNSPNRGCKASRDARQGRLAITVAAKTASRQESRLMLFGAEVSDACYLSSWRF
jgi:hypothetical protein